MLARKAKFFKSSKYYDDFSTYFATQVFFRIKNTKQFDSSYKMEKLKSVLNYMKSILYPRKVSFEQEYYSQVLSRPDENNEVLYDVNYSFSNMISESIDELSRIDFDACLHDTTKTLKNFLKRIPYYNDKNT